VGGDEEELQQILGTKTSDINKAKQLSCAKLQYSILNDFIKSKDKPIIIVPQIPELGNVCLRNAQ
jgi:parafibromin